MAAGKQGGQTIWPADIQVGMIVNNGRLQAAAVAVQCGVPSQRFGSKGSSKGCRTLAGVKVPHLG